MAPRQQFTPEQQALRAMLQASNFQALQGVISAHSETLLGFSGPINEMGEARFWEIKQIAAKKWVELHLMSLDEAELQEFAALKIDRDKRVKIQSFFGGNVEFQWEQDNSDLFPPETLSELQQNARVRADALQREKTARAMFVQTQGAEGFTDTIVPKGQAFRENLPEAPPAHKPGHGNIELLTANAQSLVMYEAKPLKEGDFIRSTRHFGQDFLQDKQGHSLESIAVIRQDFQNKVSDESQYLTPEQKLDTALKMAEMLLMNYREGDGDIIIRSDKHPPDTDMAQKVYAAVLLLKESHSNLRSINIDCRVPGVEGPGRLTRHKTFIKTQLGDIPEAKKTQVKGLLQARHDSVKKAHLSGLFHTRKAQLHEIKTGDQITEDKKKTIHYTSKPPRTQ